MMRSLVRNLVARAAKLRPGPRVSVWDVIAGGATVDDLDDAGRELLAEMFAPLKDFDPAFDPIEARLAEAEAVRPCALRELPANPIDEGE